ncbi:unnamed protein product, partial [Laminaria digitata]
KASLARRPLPRARAPSPRPRDALAHAFASQNQAHLTSRGSSSSGGSCLHIRGTSGDGIDPSSGSGSGGGIYAGGDEDIGPRETRSLTAPFMETPSGSSSGGGGGLNTPRSGGGALSTPRSGEAG